MGEDSGIPARPKVVQLFNSKEAPPQAAIPRAGVIALLEALLEAAKVGDIQAVAVAYMDDENVSSYDISGLLGSFGLLGLLGAVACMQTTLAKISCEGED